MFKKTQNKNTKKQQQTKKQIKMNYASIFFIMIS